MVHFVRFLWVLCEVWHHEQVGGPDLLYAVRLSHAVSQRKAAIERKRRRKLYASQVQILWERKYAKNWKQMETG
jgi:hypothetical protein